MDQLFMNTLDALRAQAGIPLVLNSAYRSSAWDKSKGRTGTGAHTKGKAVDIRCNNSATRLKIVQAALAIGIRRIGVAGTFVHIDTDKTLPAELSTSGIPACAPSVYEQILQRIKEAQAREA